MSLGLSRFVPVVATTVALASGCIVLVDYAGEGGAGGGGGTGAAGAGGVGGAGGGGSQVCVPDLLLLRAPGLSVRSLALSPDGGVAYLGVIHDHGATLDIDQGSGGSDCRVIAPHEVEPTLGETTTLVLAVDLTDLTVLWWARAADRAGDGTRPADITLASKGPDGDGRTLVATTELAEEAHLVRFRALDLSAVPAGGQAALTDDDLLTCTTNGVIRSLDASGATDGFSLLVEGDAPLSCSDPCPSGPSMSSLTRLELDVRTNDACSLQPFELAGSASLFGKPVDRAHQPTIARSAGSDYLAAVVGTRGELEVFATTSVQGPPGSALLGSFFAAEPPEPRALVGVVLADGPVSATPVALATVRDGGNQPSVVLSTAGGPGPAWGEISGQSGSGLEVRAVAAGFRRLAFGGEVLEGHLSAALAALEDPLSTLAGQGVPSIIDGCDTGDRCGGPYWVAIDQGSGTVYGEQWPPTAGRASIAHLRLVNESEVVLAGDFSKGLVVPLLAPVPQDVAGWFLAVRSTP